MIIQSIQHITTGQERTDGRYPSRIGCTVELVNRPVVGQCMWLSYVKDAQGQLKDGYLRTSTVIDGEETDTHLIIETLNSRYILAKDG